MQHAVDLATDFTADRQPFVAVVDHHGFAIRAASSGRQFAGQTHAVTLCSAAGVALMGASKGHYTFLSHIRWTPVLIISIRRDFPTGLTPQ